MKRSSSGSRSLASACWASALPPRGRLPNHDDPQPNSAAARRRTAAALRRLLLLLLALAQVVSCRSPGVRACFVANNRIGGVPVGRGGRRPTTSRARRTVVAVSPRELSFLQKHPGLHDLPPTARRLGRDHHADSDGSEEDLFAADESEDDASSWKERAEELREEIRKMERRLEEDRAIRKTNPNNPTSGGEDIYDDNNNKNRKEYEWMAGRRSSSSSSSSDVTTVTTNTNDESLDGFSLRNKRVLVAGANGRLGSMVCRYLLRNFPTTQVVAAVHVVGENSPTARGYGRLGYEVGAEDGIGTLGSAWSGDQRTATFQYDAESMQGYNLQNLRVVECELLDPVQCQSVVDGCDAVLWCATDFNQNVPRSVSTLNVALLFRAVTRPDKGRVDVEGVQNMLGAIKQELQERKRLRNDNNQPWSSSIVNFVLVSTSPDAYEDYETPFGSFRGIKKQGEEMVRQFPSLSTTVLQMARFEDNFVGEDLEIQMEEVPPKGGGEDVRGVTDAAATTSRRKINRRDAARAAVEALQNEGLVGKTVQVWTAT